MSVDSDARYYENINDLKQVCINLAVSLQDYVDGVSDIDRMAVQKDLDEAYLALSNVYPRTYRFEVIHSGKAPLHRMSFHLYCNEIECKPVKRFHSYDTAMRWGRPDIHGSMETALFILANEGYSEDEVLDAHWAFGRDVIGKVTVFDEVTMDSFEIEKWMDNFTPSEEEAGEV